MFLSPARSTVQNVFDSLCGRACVLGVLYLPVVRQTDDSKFLASQQPVCTAHVISQTNGTRKAENELVVLGLVTSAG